MNPFNRLFYIILFLGFFLPSNSFFYFDVFGVSFRINEIAFILLPLINCLCSSKNSVKINDKKIKILILLFIIIVLFTEFSKIIIFNESLFNTIKAIRIAIPLFSSLLLVYMGIRADIRKVWRTLLWAISISVFISLLSLVINLPIYGDVEINGSNILSVEGRLYNSNVSFAVIGLFLIFKEKNKWYNYGRLPYFVSISSIIAIILIFSRTYLAIIFFGYIYLAMKTFTWKTASKFIMIPILIFSSFLIAYTNSPAVQRQVDRRILSIILDETTISELTIVNNREIIYESVLDKIKKKYWIIGLPLSKPILIWYNKDGHDRLGMYVTDTSIITVLLRYGIIPLLILALIYIRLFKYYKIPIFKFTFLMFLLVSWNVDSLFRANSVFFLFMIFLVSYPSNNQFKKNSSLQR